MHLKSDHTAPGTLPACNQASHANSEATALEMLYLRQTRELLMLIKLKIWQNLQKLCRQRYNHCSPGSSPVASEFASDALQDIFLRTFLASYFVSYFSIFLTEKKEEQK